MVDNVFDLLKANSEGNQEKVKEITGNIIKGLAIAGTTFLLVGAALTGFQLILGKLALTLTGSSINLILLCWIIGNLLHACGIPKLSKSCCEKGPSIHPLFFSLRVA